VAHIGEECAFGAVRILGCVLCIEQLLLHLLAVDYFAFQLHGPGLKLIVGVVQRRIPMLNFGQTSY